MQRLKISDKGTINKQQVHFERSSVWRISPRVKVKEFTPQFEIGETWREMNIECFSVAVMFRYILREAYMGQISQEDRFDHECRSIQKLFIG